MKESMLSRVGAVIARAEQQRCRVRCIRLELWAYFELMSDFCACEIPYPVDGVARVRGVPVLRETDVEVALERLGRQLGDPRCVSPVVH